METKIVIPTAVIKVAGSKKFHPKIEKATYILRIEEMDDPFLYSVFPRGITTLEMPLGIPILFAANKLTGSVAKLLQVLSAVSDGATLCFQK